MSTLIDENKDNESDIEFEIGEEDYGFLVDSEGNLKTVFGPTEMLGEPPKNVQKILKIFGITNGDLISHSSTTLH
jgi:hypothetical protein